MRGTPPVSRIGIFGLLIAVFAGSNAQAKISFENTRQYFDGLRERRLFTIAENVCLRKLNDRRLSLAERAWYSVELSRTFAAHAVFASSIEEERELLIRARRIPEDVLANRPDHPQQPLLKSQALFVAAGEVETLRLRLELTPFADELRSRALKLAEETVPALSQLYDELASEIRKPSRDALGEKLKPFQLRGIQRVVRFRLASLLLDKSLLLPATSPDRAEALSQADELFRKLAAGEPGVAVTWQSQLGLLRTNRLRGDLEAVSRMINALEKDEPPLAILDEVIAEKVELMHRERKYASALETLRQHRITHHRLTGRQTWLGAKTLLELWTVAKDRGEVDLAASLLQEATTFVQRAQTNPGGFWGERCRLVMNSATTSRTYGPVIGPIVQKAQTKFAEGKVDEAITLYVDAFERAQSAKDDSALPVELGYTLGSILLKAGKPQRAATYFSTVVSIDPKGKTAAQADLLKAYSLGAAYRQQPTKERRVAYTAALESHRKQFADSATSHDATWYQAQLEERRRQTTAALRLYQTIPMTHPRGAEAQVAFARCSLTILGRLRKLKKPAGQWEAAIGQWLQTSTTPLLNSDADLSIAQAELLLLAAQIWLTNSQPDYKRADALLEKLLPTDGSARTGVPRQQVAMAKQLRIVSLAGSGKIDQAETILTQASGRGASELLVLLDGLNSASTGQTSEVRRALGQLQIDAMRRSRIDITTLPESQRVPFLRRIAEASEMAGQLAEAADAYSRLHKERPKDLNVRYQLAILRSQLPRKIDQLEAKTHWKAIEDASKPGSNEWMEARAGLIAAHIQLEETEQAKKLLTVTKLIYRNAGSLVVRQKLAGLEKQIKDR